MFQNKLLQWSMMILIAITLIALACFVLWDYMERNTQSANPNEMAVNSVDGVQGKLVPAEEVQALTYEIKDITTNLSTTKDFVKISFAFEMENKKVREEIELLSPKVNAIIISTLADLSPTEIQGSKGYDLISSQLTNKINPILSRGKLKSVFVTSISIAVQ